MQRTRRTRRRRRSANLVDCSMLLGHLAFDSQGLHLVALGSKQHCLLRRRYCRRCGYRLAQGGDSALLLSCYVHYHYLELNFWRCLYCQCPYCRCYCRRAILRLELLRLRRLHLRLLHLRLPVLRLLVLEERHLQRVLVLLLILFILAILSIILPLGFHSMPHLQSRQLPTYPMIFPSRQPQNLLCVPVVPF